MKIKNGGTAFPAVIASPHDFPDGSILPLGLTKRDWFAGMALNGIYAGGALTTDGDQGNYARAAYQIADAMLDERDGEPQPCTD